ncbi:F-box domain [Macleaya cordata]|uniref:F-box domain n=1 Tax=Macleaya cordata TaxID=56857 RepID=A0A200Q012_MACCD|nr:F-box domain [Macleaya cordata]
MKWNESTGNGKDDENILCEILSRLPVKSLMQFKRVCKRWQYLIQQDPYFTYLHLARSKSRLRDTIFLLLICGLPMDRGRKSFFSGDLFEGISHANGAPKKLALGRTPHQILKPVNGLICFGEYAKGSVLIYNPSTGERTSWIEPTISIEKIGRRERAQCFGFGFDPTTKEHKVICIWEVLQSEAPLNNPEEVRVDQFCEVLTVGENTWRRIDEVPPFKLYRDSVYVNGSIYWRNNRGNITIAYPKQAEVIVAFDVGSEKFRVIPIPNFILDQRPQMDV